MGYQVCTAVVPGGAVTVRRSRVVAMTAPVVGRTMTLPAGTRLVALYSLDDGRWVVTFNGAQFAVQAVPVEWQMMLTDT